MFYRSKEPIVTKEGAYDLISRFAPSAFTDHPHPKVSDKYIHIPTIKIVDQFLGLGFMPVYAGQSHVRVEGKNGFQKHVLRFRHPSDKFRMVGDVLPEIILTNSHDRMSSYQLFAGLYRLVCENGMVVTSSLFKSIRIRHMGFTSEELYAGIASIIDRLPIIREQVQLFHDTILNQEQRLAFAKDALAIRWPQSTAKTPIEAEQLLEVHRDTDKEPTLWNTFNVVQENIVKGGIQGRNQNNRWITTRAVTSIDRDIRINASLWELADEYAKIVA